MSSYNTPYDDVFRTLLTDCRNLIIPVVNEIFKEHYTGREQVILTENEIFLRRQKGEEDKKITDSTFAIVEGVVVRNYHLECQSTPDGSMVIRMYEYDSQIALKDSTLENGKLNVNFPQSAVLYLRHTGNTTDVLTITINTPGGSVSYNVPALKVKCYTIEEIFEKKLLFLIPFYIFTYEGDFEEIEASEDKLGRIKGTYSHITQRLENLCLTGELDEYTKQTICEMSEKVLLSIAEKYENIKKEVTEVMGGQVLDYEAKRILNRGIEQGKAEGMELGKAEGIELGKAEGKELGKAEGIELAKAEAVRNMLTKGFTCEEISDILELDLARVRQIREEQH